MRRVADMEIDVVKNLVTSFARSSARVLPVACSIALANTALAQGDLPPNNIDCTIFRKTESHWVSDRPTTIELGRGRINLGSQHVSRRAIVVNGHDLYDAIEKKCGATRP